MKILLKLGVNLTKKLQNLINFFEILHIYDCINVAFKDKNRRECD